MSALECGWARRAVDRRFDAEPLTADELARLEAHLAACADCRRTNAELAEVRRRLRAMAPQRFPDEALEAVWARTSRAAGSTSASSSRRSWSAGWRAAAAAAVVVLASGGLIWFGGLEPAGPSDAELRRAAEESRMVLGLTAQAMRRTERVAVRQVLGEDVSGALRRVPVDWPAAAGVVGVPDGNDGSK